MKEAALVVVVVILVAKTEAALAVVVEVVETEAALVVTMEVALSVAERHRWMCLPHNAPRHRRQCPGQQRALGKLPRQGSCTGRRRKGDSHWYQCSNQSYPDSRFLGCRRLSHTRAQL